MFIRDTNLRRQLRVRKSIKEKSGGRLRLSIFRSNLHMSAQIIDDVKGITLVSASTMETEHKSKLKSTSNIEASTLIGKVIAERALQKGIKQVVFDRGRFFYHGKVKALAEAARQVGLDF